MYDPNEEGRKVVFCEHNHAALGDDKVVALETFAT
jgi:hypothetical protein